MPYRPSTDRVPDLKRRGKPAGQAVLCGAGLYRFAPGVRLGLWASDRWPLRELPHADLQSTGYTWLAGDLRGAIREIALRGNANGIVDNVLQLDPLDGGVHPAILFVHGVAVHGPSARGQAAVASIT
jgi:hypothetical protein